MTKSAITRERLEWLSQISCRDDIEDIGGDEIRELASMALAAMDSEPVAWINGCNKSVPAALRYLAENPRPIGGESSFNTAHLYQLAREIELMAEAPLYRHAQPAPARDRVRCEHAEWSHATFGNVGPVGPLKHLSKEALEAAAEPGDLSEWADMQFLMWDAQRRAGITDEQITQAMIEKLVVNKQRSWPEPKEGEPRLHIKEQPAPVVPDRMNYQDGVLFVLNNDMSSIERGTVAMRAWNACRAAMLAAADCSIPMISDRWIPVSEQLPEECGRYWCYVEEQTDLGKSHYQWNCSWNGERWWVEGEDGGIVTHWMPLPAAPQEVK